MIIINAPNTTAPATESTLRTDAASPDDRLKASCERRCTTTMTTEITMTAAHAHAAAYPGDVQRLVLTEAERKAYEPYAFMVWNFLETIHDRCADDPRLLALMSRHPSVPSTSILSKTDGIVSWPMSLIPQNGKSENIEVNASHFGMGANPTVLWAVADRLAQPEGKWKPFKRDGLRSLVYDDPHRDSGADLFAT